MKKNFISNLLLIVVLNLLIKPFAIFGIDATVQNRVGTDVYGVYFSLLNLSYLFNIVMDLGINNYTTKNIAQYPDVVSKYINKLFNFRLILFVLYAIITLSIGIGIGYTGDSLKILLLLIFNQFLVTLISYFRSHFGGLHLFKTDAIISVLDKVLLILVGGSLLIATSGTSDFTIELFIWIQTFSYALTLAIAFLMLIRSIGLPKFKFDWVFSLVILRKSYPYALLTLLMMLYTRIDSIMIERIHPSGAYEAGYYAQGFRLLDAFFMFGMIFANLLLPIFARLLKSNPNGITELLNASRDMLVGGAILLAFICFAHGEYILKLVYNYDYQFASASFKWIMWSFIGMCISIIYGTLLTAGGKMKFLNQLAVGSIILNILLNIYLIPRYGAQGAAFATCITQLSTSLVQLIFCHQTYSLEISPLFIGKYAILFGINIGLLFLPVETTTHILIQLIVGIISLFILKFIDLKSVKDALIINYDKPIS